MSLHLSGKHCVIVLFCTLFIPTVNFVLTVDSEDQLILQGPGPFCPYSIFFLNMGNLCLAMPVGKMSDHHMSVYFLKSLSQRETVGDISYDSVFGQWDADRSLLAMCLLLNL